MVFGYFSGKTLKRDGEKYSYSRLLSKICVNSTKTFQTQTELNWASFLDEDPNMAYDKDTI